MSEETSDHILIQDIAKGSQKSFAILFQRYKARVMGACFYMLSDRALAEDISQETWVAVVEHASDYKPTGSALGWILTVSRHKCLNELRARKKWTDLDAETAEQVPDPAAGLEQLMQEHGEEQQLKDAILQLSETQRVTLLMFVQEEKSIAEIAKELNASVSAIKVQLFRARETLKKKLGAL